MADIDSVPAVPVVLQRLRWLHLELDGPGDAAAARGCEHGMRWLVAAGLAAIASIHVTLPMIRGELRVGSQPVWLLSAIAVIVAAATCLNRILLRWRRRVLHASELVM